MSLEPRQYAQLIIEHMDDSETVIEFNDRDATEWKYNVHGIRVKRRNGWTRFPWLTVKSYTIVYSTDYVKRIEDRGNAQ